MKSSTGCHGLSFGLIVLSHLVLLTMSSSSLLIDYELLKRNRQKRRSKQEGKKERLKDKKKISCLGRSPAVFVPNTLLFFLWPHSAVPPSRESEGKQHRGEVLQVEGTTLTGPTLNECLRCFDSS